MFVVETVSVEKSLVFESYEYANNSVIGRDGFQSTFTIVNPE